MKIEKEVHTMWQIYRGSSLCLSNIEFGFIVPQTQAMFERAQAVFSVACGKSCTKLIFVCLGIQFDEMWRPWNTYNSSPICQKWKK